MAKKRPRQPFRLYQRPNSPHWWVYFTIKGHPKPYRFSTDVPLAQVAEASRKAAELFVERSGAPGGGAALPASVLGQFDLKQLAAMWLAQLETDHPGNPRYCDRAETDLFEYIVPTWARLEDITTASWRQLTWDPETRVAGAMHHSRGGKLRWRSIANLANTLRHFLRWCVRKGALASVPEIQSPPTKLQEADRSPRKAMDEDQREEFLWALALMEEERALRIYTVLFETWVRKSTLEAMTLRWVDFKAETITLPAAFNKSRKEKVIDLTPRAAEVLRAQVADWNPVELDKPVFGVFDFHQAWDAEKKGGLFGRALGMAGIDAHGLTPHHSTRHSSLTIAGRKPAATLSGMMRQAGIDSANIIEKHYLHPALEDARRITRSA